MSEEEIIKYVYEIIKDSKNEIQGKDYFEYIMTPNDINAIQGLLDLYNNTKESELLLANKLQKINIELNKEKDKNKELQIIKSGIEVLQSNYALDDTYYVIAKRDFLDGSYKNLLDNYVNKDEIRNKIKELKEIADNGANAVRFAVTYEDQIERMERQEYISTMIGILKELLEENEIE